MSAVLNMFLLIFIAIDPHPSWRDEAPEEPAKVRATRVTTATTEVPTTTV